MSTDDLSKMPQEHEVDLTDELSKMLQEYETALAKLKTDHQSYAHLKVVPTTASQVAEQMRFREVCKAIGDPELRLRHQILKLEAEISILTAMLEVSKPQTDKVKALTEMLRIYNLFKDHKVRF